MLERIYNELGKLIAKDIYDAAKSAPNTIATLKKRTALRTSGAGIPEAVLQRFDQNFVSVMSSLSSRGFAKWRVDGTEASFNFYLTSDVVGELAKKGDWAAAASRTADGTQQVQVCGGSDKYNELIAKVVPTLVTRAIDACVGVYHRSSANYGWEVLAPSKSTDVAKRDKTEFTPLELFYMEKGSEEVTSKKYKSAKKCLHARWFGFSEPPAPFEGPYLR